VVSEAGMAGKFFGLFVHSERVIRVVGGRLLGQALDGNELAVGQILGHEYHTERAMVEGRNGLESTVENDAVIETIPEAFHGERGVEFE
jgi:hypothetical protein